MSKVIYVEGQYFELAKKVLDNTEYEIVCLGAPKELLPGVLVYRIKAEVVGKQSTTFIPEIDLSIFKPQYISEDHRRRAEAKKL